MVKNNIGRITVGVIGSVVSLYFVRIGMLVSNRLLSWGIIIVSLYFAYTSVLYTYRVVSGSRTIESDIAESFVDAMADMADESGRTHRGMVGIYLKEVDEGVLPNPSHQLPDGPSGKGLFKARLFGALFMVAAHKCVFENKDQLETLLDISFEMAIKPIIDDDSFDFNRQDANQIFASYTKHTLRSILKSLSNTPISPESDLTSISSDFDFLCDQLHDALSDSIGSEIYTAKVEEKFDERVRYSCANAVNHASEWMLELKQVSEELNLQQI